MCCSLEWLLSSFHFHNYKSEVVVQRHSLAPVFDTLNYFVANKYIEALKAMADSPNQKMLLMPIEATGVIGSLAGIAELAKNALEKQVTEKPQRGAPPARPQ